MTTLRKIFIINIVLFTIVSFIPENCFGLVKDWGRKWGSDVNYCGAYSVSIDSNDNSYVTGKTYWHFDGQTNYGVFNIFLTKHNSSGVKQWTRIWGPTNSAGIGYAAVGYDVAIDSDSNCYVTGETTGPFDGQGEGNSYDVFLTKYNSLGTKLWTRIWGSTNGYETGRSVSIGIDNYCYVTGYASGEFAGQTNDGPYKCFLTKFSSSGVEQWTRICLTTEVEYAYAVSASAAGIYITGYTRNLSNGDWKFFLTKCSSSGVEQWTKFWGSDTYDYAEGVAVDSSGNAYVAGYTFGEFDGQTNAGSYDACLTKFSSSGGKLWSRIWGSTAIEYGKDVDVDVFGNVYVTGLTGGDFDGQINNGPYDCFLTKFSSSGEKLWTKIWGSTGVDYTDGVSINSSGTVCYATGYSDSYIIDGNTNTTGNIYLRKFVDSVSPSEIFADANPLPDNSGIADGNNSSAITETGEPPHANNGGPYHSVWWDLSAPTITLLQKKTDGDDLFIDTHGSDFDTVLAIYTGSAVNNLTQVAANDNSGSGIETSEVTFLFNSGVTYHIAVDGKTASDTGNIILNYAIIPEPVGIIWIIGLLELWIAGRNRWELKS